MTPGITFVDGSPLLIPHLQAAWENPAALEAERRAGQAKIDRLFQQHDARRLAERERIWAMIEGEQSHV